MGTEYSVELGEVELSQFESCIDYSEDSGIDKRRIRFLWIITVLVF